MVQLSPCISGALPCLSCTIQVLISIVWRPQTGVVIVRILVLVLIPVASEQPLFCILCGWLNLRLHLIQYQLVHLLWPFQRFLQRNTSEKVTFGNTNVILCCSTTWWSPNKKNTYKFQGKFPSSSFSKLTNRQKIASHLVLCLIMSEIQNDGLRHRRKDFLLDSEFKIRGEVWEMQVQRAQLSLINGSLTASACRCTLLRSKTSETAHSGSTATLDRGDIWWWGYKVVPVTDQRLRSLPATWFSGRVLTMRKTWGPSPAPVAAARLMLYFDPGVKFSKRCSVADADTL